MRRLWTRRLLAAPFALWFVLTTIDSDRLHACPLHGLAHGSRAAAGDEQARAPDAHGHAAGLPEHATRGHGGARHGACTCPGDCCAPAAVARIEPAITLTAVTIIDDASGRAPDSVRVRPGSAQVALPPSVGPPPTPA